MFYIVLFVWLGKSEAILLSGCGLDSVMRLQSRSWSELQSSKAWLEPGDTLPKWSIHMAVGRKPPFLAKCALHWTGPASLTSFQHGTSLSRRNLAEKGQEGSRNASCDFVSEVTYHHFSHILFTRCQWVTQSSLCLKIQELSCTSWEKEYPGLLYMFKNHLKRNMWDT